MTNTTVVSTRVDADDLKRLQRFAAADRRTMSGVLSLALEEFLSRHTPRNERKRGTTRQ